MADKVYATHAVGTEIVQRGKGWFLVDGDLERELADQAEAEDIAVNGRGWRHSKDGWTIHGDPPDEVTADEAAEEADANEVMEGHGYSKADLNEMTKADLYEIASEWEVDGRSQMNKDELVAALTKLR